MTPTLAYLLGLATLPALFVGSVLAFLAVDRVVGWWRAPTRRWSALARQAGAERALAVRDGRVYGMRLHSAALYGAESYWWARWCPWWPA